ncbi:MAG: hypothetical protein KGH55_03235, partial [Nanoarchaeota archaeon]|nr:hypothetical protein [Nanoarchaeota archaeon]
IIIVASVILVVLLSIGIYQLASRYNHGNLNAQNYPGYTQNSALNNSGYSRGSQGYSNQNNYGSQGQQIANVGDGINANAGSLPDCSGTSLLDFSPIAVNSLTGIEAMGHMNGEHVLPDQADHIYLNTNQPQAVYSPGNVTVLGVVAENGTTGRENSSYVVLFSPCKSVMFAFQMVNVSDKILNAIAGQSPVSCQGGMVANICSYALNLSFQSGEQMGTSASEGIDFAAADVRTQPLAFIDQGEFTGFMVDSYLHAVCPLDYFDNATKGTLYGKITMKNQGANGIPACGITMQDLPGTAQGNWYLQNATMSGNYQGLNIPSLLAIVHSNLDASLGEISAGSDLIPSTDLGAQMTFTPLSSGLINREPSQITSDGNVYCFDGAVGIGANGNEGHVDIQMTDSVTMKVDYSSGVCPATPTLSSSALVYTR